MRARNVLGQLLALALFCLSAKAQTPGSTATLDNSLIRASGTAPVYLLRNGQKYHIQTPNWMSKNGYDRNAVHDLPYAEIAAIPTGHILNDDDPVPGTAAAVEGKLIVGTGGRIYIVRGGARHWILSLQWITESRYAGQKPILVSEAELQAIPLGTSIQYIPREIELRFFWLRTALFLLLAAFLFTSSRVATRKYLARRFPHLAASNLWQNWKSGYTRTLLFIGFALAIVWREPYVLAHPRFWAEEGTIWFQYGASHSILKTLLFIFAPSSYINLTANIGALLSSRTAAICGLEYAPAATTIFAFLIQLLAIGLILFGRSRLFDSLWKAVAGCLIVIFASTTSDEIWFNTINSMSFLGLITLILLFEETWKWPRSWRWVTRAILFLCGMSSPYACALLPLFLIFALRDQYREQKIQCLILFICAFVQAGSVILVRLESMRTGSEVGVNQRGTEVHLDTSLVNVFLGHMTYAGVGYSARELLVEETGLESAWESASSFPPRPVSTSLRLAGWLCFLLIAITLWSLRGPTLFSMPNVAIAVFITFAIFTCITALHSVPTGRYAFMPGITFLFILLVDIESARWPWMRYVSLLVLAYGLAAGIVVYRTRLFQSGPSWAAEVDLWRKDHSHLLRVWPETWETTNGAVSYEPAANR